MADLIERTLLLGLSVLTLAREKVVRFVDEPAKERMKKRYLRFTYLLLSLIVGLLLLSSVCSAVRTQAAASATPWTVFTPVDDMSDNLLTNPGFEDNLNGWVCYGSGCTVDDTVAHSGTRSLKLVNPVITEKQVALQIITFDPPTRRPLYFSGWSKAECVSGAPDIHYSVYLDVYYTDGDPLYGQVLQFDTCPHDWQFREGFVIPTKTIQTVKVHCLLRDTHRGTVWFDDLKVQEVQAEIVFDSVPVTTSQSSTPPYGGPDLPLATGDGLALTLAAEGGAITGVTLDGTPVQDSDRTYASGFFVRDVANKSDFIQVGGSLTRDGNVIAHTSTISELNLGFSATYTATADRIAVHAEVADTSVSTRSLTLYFALPIAAEDWTWGDDIRTGRIISGTDEFANFIWHEDIGANGRLSKYPWASLSEPELVVYLPLVMKNNAKLPQTWASSRFLTPLGGIALGVPLDSPRAMRLIHNPVTNQFYAAFDLGLSQETTKFPGRAWVDLVLYRFDGDWGFRAAAQGYYDRFTEAFTRRIPPEEEGIWVAFSDLWTITDVVDFGIAFHELGCLNQVPFDEENGIFSFRYIAEPWSHWMPINDTNVDPYSPTQVIAYLQEQYEQEERELLTNPGFEDDPPGIGWTPYVSGYIVDPTVAHSGTRSLKLINPVSTGKQGALQTIVLNQTKPRPLYFSGCSKAENVTGDLDIHYSVYLDVYYTDGDPLYGQVLQFYTGTHEWQCLEDLVVPTKTIKAVNVHCLLRDTHSGTAWFDDLSVWEVGRESERVTATLSSGFFDKCDRYRYEPYGAGQVPPWCNGQAAGCAAFILNPDPDISDTIHMLDKAHLEWNQAAREAYTTMPGLDGEYVDSFLGRATVMDFRTAHFAATDTPLTYRTSDRRVGLPEVFATTEFARWLAQDVHDNLGKWTMANWILRDLPWGADLFDVMGTEINWLSNSNFVPESDAILSYRRTLAYRRPYCLLMNTNFDNLSYELVERYFRVCLFYGIYPSMFSHNAAEDPYWEDPSLYNRDRDLFKRYIPLIRQLNEAGWQPVTYAATSDPEVYIERFGDWPDLYFTLRNMTDASVTVSVTLQADTLGLPAVPLTAAALLAGTQHPLSAPASTRTLTVTLGPRASEILDF